MPITGQGTEAFLLIQWKHAMRLEAKGFGNKQSRSVRKHAATMLGLKSSATVEEVTATIEALLAAR